MKIRINLIENKNNLYFTSDFHLFHENIIKFDKRPFNNVEHMHEVLLKNWNETVDKDDIVVYLGDLSFSNKNEKSLVSDFINNLNGDIHFIMGNHDDFKEIIGYKRFKTVNDYLEIKLTHDFFSKEETSNICCMHYPLLSWNKGHHGSIMLHGHCHMSLSDSEFHQNKRILDVGCNGHGYTPVSIREILEITKEKEYKLTTKHH